jgi:PAS domain S-box-containing protein
MGLTLFVLVGTAISWLANSVRQRTSRLQEFEKVVEGLEEMIVVIDRNYRYLIANRAFLQYRGLKREDVIGRHLSEVLNPAVFENTIKGKLDECFRGQVVHYEMSYRYAGHGERELLIHYLPISGQRGIDRVACVLRDVTEQKRAAAAVRESEDRYRDLVEHSEDLVCTHDLSGKLLSVNPAPARLLGYTVEELLNIPMRDLLAPEFRAQFNQYINTIREKLQDSGLLCVLTKDGRRRIWNTGILFGRKALRPQWYEASRAT